MTKFSWEEIYQRREALAEQIRQRIGLSFGLTGDVKDSFDCFLGRGHHEEQFLADQPMWRVPFQVIALGMREFSDGHVIDHAWWLIANDRSGEPWGFVTEPYMAEAKAESVAAFVRATYSEWGVDAQVWPTDASPWNPGSTLPIAVMVSVGTLPTFLRLGVGAALARLG